MDTRSELISMKKIIIPFVAVVTAFTLNSIIGAEDNKTKYYIQPSVVEASPIIVPIPRPNTKVETCPRNEPSSPLTNKVETIDTPIPQHCLELNCGLGVYSKQSENAEERCSFCGALRPTKG